MSSDPPVTAVEIELRRRRRWIMYPIVGLALLLAALGFLAAVAGVSLLLPMTRTSVPYFADPVEHFERGSIGAEIESGLPYWMWRALPRLFPEHFEGRSDYRAFGFLYRTSKDGEQHDLPVGITRTKYRGFDLVWINCATCHTGTWRKSENESPTIVPGMPSNNLDLYRFIGFLLDIAADERLSADSLIPAMRAAGANLGFTEEMLWRYYLIPRVREGLIMRRSRLQDFLAGQSPWGPGRVDTFNPFKLVNLHMPVATLAPEERVGTSDFPAVFNQKPRDGLQLHWDGNNPSLDERNLSAATGSGVTPETVNHESLQRVAAWLGELRPPASPHEVDRGAAERGQAIYRIQCAACHGALGNDGYEFRGAKLGKVEPISQLGTDPGRLNSYTERFRQQQLSTFFAGTKYQFKHFIKTDGYANLPLDGLWLRGPYLHNGSVPTLRALLSPPSERPVAFIRGIDVIDSTNGGFMSPPCDPARPPAKGFCYDTRLPGNGNGGHLYGTALDPAEKADLLAYLLTF